MKKIIPIVISAILVVYVIPFQAFATDVSETSNIIECIEGEVGQTADSQELLTKARDDLENLESVGFTEDILEFSQITPQGEILYSIKLPNDGFDFVSVNEDNNGNLTLDIYEGDIHDILTYKNDGSIYVNGNKIEIPPEDVTISTSEEAQDITDLYANARSVLFSMSPFVARNTYTTYVSTYEYSKASWGIESLKNAAISTIAGILSAGIGAILGLPAIPVALLTNLALAMQNEATVYGMQDAYYSFRFRKYKSTASPVLQHDFMYTGICYSKRGWTGTEFPHTFYECNAFS